MKGQKKALAASIASVVQGKLNESGEQSKKAIKAIEKAAKKLVEKLGKITSKEKKKLNRAKKNEAIAAKAEKKEVKRLEETNPRPVTSTETELITVD